MCVLTVKSRKKLEQIPEVPAGIERREITPEVLHPFEQRSGRAISYADVLAGIDRDALWEWGCLQCHTF